MTIKINSGFVPADGRNDKTGTTTDIAAIALALAIGVGLIFAAGFSSAAVMHDTGHDQRHSIAFPCH